MTNISQVENKTIAAENTKSLFRSLLVSDLDFGNNKKTHLVRHYWHPFPAKFPPELPKVFIETLTQSGQIVLDPMAGSCTTLLEAAMTNRQAIGFDIDPLSLLIGKAKSTNFTPRKIMDIGLEVVSLAEFDFVHARSKLTEQRTKRFDADTLKFFDYWFLSDTQIELLSLLNHIERIESQEIQTFLKLIFSGIIIAKSGGVSLAKDLAHTRPHRVMDKKISSVFAEFAKRLNKILGNGYEDLPQQLTLHQGDAKSLTLKDETVDLIFTSPPYANNAIDYMRAHKFSLTWLGHSIQELSTTRRKYIGSEAITGLSLEMMPPNTSDKILELYKLNKSKSRSLHRYFSEMTDVLKEMYRVLKPQRACALVVATSILNGLDVETQNCLAEIGQTIGFELVGIGTRNIHRDSRMLPTSMTKNASQIEARMHTEFVIGFWKN